MVTNMGLKSERLVIRCDKETKRRFKTFIARMGFSNYADGLNWLLARAEKEWSLGKIY